MENEWLNQARIFIMEWSSQSPDLTSNVESAVCAEDQTAPTVLRNLVDIIKGHLTKH